MEQSGDDYEIIICSRDPKWCNKQDGKGQTRVSALQMQEHLLSSQKLICYKGDENLFVLHKATFT